jgi:hypothetical protein
MRIINFLIVLFFIVIIAFSCSEEELLPNLPEDKAGILKGEFNEVEIQINDVSILTKCMYDYYNNSPPTSFKGEEESTLLLKKTIKFNSKDAIYSKLVGRQLSLSNINEDYYKINNHEIEILFDEDFEKINSLNFSQCYYSGMPLHHGGGQLKKDSISFKLNNFDYKMLGDSCLKILLKGNGLDTSLYGFGYLTYSYNVRASGGGYTYKSINSYKLIERLPLKETSLIEITIR